MAAKCLIGSRFADNGGTGCVFSATQMRVFGDATNPENLAPMRVPAVFSEPPKPSPLQGRGRGGAVGAARLSKSQPQQPEQQRGRGAFLQVGPPEKDHP